MEATQALLFWGFQGTIDHRVSLDEDQFHALGLEPPAEDQERFVSRSELNSMLERLQGLGLTPASTPGGSPLISALTAAAWFSDQHAHAAARFVGARPMGLSGYVDSDARNILSLAQANPAIGGTLALEYRASNSKLMLAVAEGRWLDEALAERSIEAIGNGVFALQPALVGVGIGGLNKATPSAVLHVIEEMRRLPVPAVIFATGSSFRQDVAADRPADFWDRLLEVFAGVDVISLSSAEQRQLDTIWGDSWIDRLLDAGTLKLAVRHSSKDAVFSQSETGRYVLEDAESILEVARAEATRNAARALTGLGARFDGVLSAATLLAWRPSAK